MDSATTTTIGSAKSIQVDDLFNSTVLNWSKANDEDCSKLKEQVYDLHPIWKDCKLAIIPATEDGTFVFRTGKQQLDNNCVFYNSTTKTLCTENKPYFNYIPPSRQIIATYSTESLLCFRTHLVFFNFTGLYVVEVHREGSGWTLYFDNKDTFDLCIEYCKINFSLEDNKIGYNLTQYSFDTLKDMSRVDRWYYGEWKDMIKKGISNDSEYFEKGMVKDGPGFHYPKYHTNSYDEFVTFISKTRNNDVVFECDLCATKGYYLEFHHCLTCVKADASFDACLNCVNDKKSLEHDPIHVILPPTTDELVKEYIRFMKHRETE